MLQSISSGEVQIESNPLFGRFRKANGLEQESRFIICAPITKLQWTAFTLHALLITVFFIPAIIGVQHLSIGIFFSLPTQQASNWVSTVLLIVSNLLSTSFSFGTALVMQRLYLKRERGDAKTITVASYLLVSAYTVCIVTNNIVTPLIFTLELMPTPLFNKIHLNTFPYYLGFTTAVLLFLLGSPLFLSRKSKAQTIMLF